MNLNVEFPAEIEQALQTQAAAAGMDLSDFVRELVTEKLATQPTGAVADEDPTREETQKPRRSPTEFQSRLRALIDLHPRSGHVDDSRESIYAGRGE